VIGVICWAGFREYMIGFAICLIPMLRSLESTNDASFFWVPFTLTFV